SVTASSSASEMLASPSPWASEWDSGCASAWCGARSRNWGWAAVEQVVHRHIDLIHRGAAGAIRITARAHGQRRAAQGDAHHGHQFGYGCRAAVVAIADAGRRRGCPGG